jgi:hypothetical protein
MKRKLICIGIPLEKHQILRTEGQVCLLGCLIGLVMFALRRLFMLGD